MKIKSLSVWKEEFQLTRPYAIAFKFSDSATNFFIEIQTEDGRMGMGAAAPEPHVTGETNEACEKALKSGAVANLEGKELNSFDSILSSLKEALGQAPAARVAVEMALYDLKAQEAQMPLAKWLGQKIDRLPTSITIGIKNLEETLEEAREYLDRGFKVIKVKLGGNVEQDIERTIKLRELVGSDIGIRVDMNQDYDFSHFESYLEKTANSNVEFFEQPFAVSNRKALEQVGDSERERLCIDEALLSDEDAKTFVEPVRLAGIFNIKLMKSGGISTALAIAEVAKAHGVSLMWGCMDESRVSISAALHTAFACENTRYLDLDGHLDLGRDLVEGGFHLQQGWLSLTDRAGLGVVRCQ